MNDEQLHPPPATPRRPSWPWLALVAVLILVGGFAGYGIDWFGETPREGWEAVVSAAEAGDWGAVWDRFDADSQNRLAPVVREYARGLDPDGTAGMSDRQQAAITASCSRSRSSRASKCRMPLVVSN